ncbi:MAG TPA: sulfatase-like hydrolase/transferase, partial [Planctomycetota bacterium]|nr:sulfatase-like hydrolase/transferase [Planctomycetota bacterium]
SGRDEPALESFASLSSRGATFLRHRAPTTLDVANMATLLTGLSPESHGLLDTASRLPASVATLMEAARESQVRTSFITAVPTSFAPFGLSQGAAETVEHSPVSGDDAAAPLRAATSWLVRALAEPDQRAVVVAHVRGGHPPWTPTPKQLEALPPRDYSGNLQPRRAAQQIAEIRARRNPEVSESDRVRMRALHALALAQHDIALGESLTTLETAQLLDQTLIVVTADAATSVEQLFAPDLPLAERSLALPLWIVFPGGKLAGQRVALPTKMSDVAQTLHAALGLAPPPALRGEDLFALASGRSAAGERIQVATMGNLVSARWGDLVITGALGKAPSLCDLQLDPTCAFDRRATSPLAVTALFRATLDELAQRGTRPPHEALILDDTTRSALTVWGR